MPPAPPLSKQVKNMTEAEIARRVAADPDAGETPADFWHRAELVEPDTLEQITLRLPKRVLRHFRAGGKGYHSRISAVLSSYVAAQRKKA